jgi:tRNA(fMet)-specific endonuclease VapC
LGYLLDTSVAIHLRDGDPVIKALVGDLDSAPFLSALTWVELESGIYAKPDLAEQRRAAVDVLLVFLPVLDFDAEMAEVCGRILETVPAPITLSAELVEVSKGRMIAATALVEGLTLITVNGEDFRDVPGLELMVWEVGG